MGSQRQDMASNVLPKVGLTPATISSSTTTVGNIIDSNGFNAALAILAIGTRTDGTFTLKVEEGNDPALGDAVVCAVPNLIIPDSAAVLASNGIVRVGWVKGNYRYVRFSIVSTLVTSGATLARIDVLLGTPNLGAVA